MSEASEVTVEDRAEDAPRVLVVDDDVTLLLLMSEALRDIGLIASTAENGSEAIAQYRQFEPNLILLDIEMPEMDGISACAAIREDPESRDVPIVMVTGLDDAASIHRAFDAGATDFILKPINWPLFQHRVHSILVAAHNTEELVSSHARISSLEQVAPDLALIVKRNGQVVERLGVGAGPSVPPSASARTLDDFWPAEIAETMRMRVKRVLKTRENVSYEFALPSDDETRYYEARFVAHGRDRVLLVAQQISSRTSAPEMYELAYFDSVTHLPNRHLFEKSFSECLADTTLRERRLAVLCFDLSEVVHARSRLGRAGREHALQKVAARVIDAISELGRFSAVNGDRLQLARLSGSEFALVINNISSRKDVTDVAARVRSSLDDQSSSSGGEITAAPIMGISLFPDDGGDVATLLEAAEAAMQVARVAKDGSAYFYSDTTAKSELTQLDLVAELRWAIEHGQLEVHYQPRAEIESERVVGVEALLRWHHPLRGFVPLEELIPLAETSGLIRQVGEWVLRTACLAVSQLNERLTAQLGLSINLSHQEFFRSDLLEHIRRAIRDTSFDARLLELELTEQTLIQSEDPVTSLERLNELGVGYILDDFGTGFSSLTLLKRLPIRALKLDRSFVAGIPNSREDAAACNIIISTAKTLGLRSVAEGVETGEQVRFLRRHGCNEMQGYFISAPLTATDLEKYLHPAQYRRKKA